MMKFPKYLNKCNKIKGYTKRSRIIRLFVTYYIQKYFSVHGFTPKILPVLQYNGLKDTTLLHFTILGFAAKNSASGVPSYQKLADILNSKFISIDQEKLINKMDNFEEELDVQLNPVKYFTDSKTFSKLWT